MEAAACSRCMGKGYTLEPMVYGGGTKVPCRFCGGTGVKYTKEATRGTEPPKEMITEVHRTYQKSHPDIIPIEKTETTNNIKTMSTTFDLENSNRAGLAKLFKAFFEKTSAKNWVSVKELNLTKLATEFEVPRNFTPFISDLLEKHGVIEVEGNRSGMKYKRTKGYTIPDWNELALKAIELKKEFYRRYNKSGDQTASVGITDKQKRKYVRKVKPELEIKITKRSHFNVDDICYCLSGNVIVEFEVVGVTKEDIDGSITYYHNLKNKKNNIKLLDVNNAMCFESPERLVENLIKRVRTLK